VLSLCTSTFLSGELALVVFGAALVSWLVTESIVVGRLMNHALPREKRPTLGIHTTPAAIGCLACLSLVPDAASAWPRLLFGYGLLQALVVLRLVPWLRATMFSPSAWAYTFGASALAGSAIQFASRVPGSVVAQLALPIFVAANGVIGWIFLRTAAFAFRAMRSRGTLGRDPPTPSTPIGEQAG
jgi:tellurite resistance protein